MRTVVFNEGAKERYLEARDIINQAYKENQIIGEKMQASFASQWTQLLNILMNGSEDENYSLEIGPDFVKGSFYFAFKRGETMDLNGGVILHGFGETFSVELTSESYPHWSIHT